MDYKNEIIKLINKLNASDETFLKQVYIIGILIFRSLSG